MQKPAHSRHITYKLSSFNMMCFSSPLFISKDLFHGCDLTYYKFAWVLLSFSLKLTACGHIARVCTFM